VIALERDPALTALGVATTLTPVVVSIETETEQAPAIMREHAVRRLPVVDGDGALEGIVSLGDLAVDRDREPVLGAISAARPTTDGLAKAVRAGPLPRRRIEFSHTGRKHKDRRQR
jgi:CBS-domain-containing membrane protein